MSRVQNIKIISEKNCKKLQSKLVSLEEKWEIEQKGLTDPNSAAAKRFKYLLLSRHEIKEITEKILGLDVIRYGFSGQGWGSMISFFARMLEVDPERRANVDELLDDEFIKNLALEN